MDELFNNNLNGDNTEPEASTEETAVTAEIQKNTAEPMPTEKEPAAEATEPDITDTAENTDTADTPSGFGFADNGSQPLPPIYNPVSYSPVKPVKDYRPMSRGLKVFSLILVAIIALTGTSLIGYYVGKNEVSFSANKKTTTKVDLAAKPEATDEMTAAEVYAEVNESVVGITVYNTSGEGGQASGIVFSKDGYIITNDHIYSEIANAKFKIHTHDGKEYDAKYVAGDLISDLAVLKIENCDLKPAVFGDSDELYEGQNVVAIGRPNDATDTSSITRGIISALNRRVSNSSNYSARLIQTDSPINPGSSGGALVNMYGQVVGVTSSKLASVDYEGVGYAIPTTVMKHIVEELIDEGKVVSRAKLGITYTEINSVLAEINGYDYTGLLVASVSEDSDLYGKIGEGDVITKINDVEITSADLVLDIIEQCSAGDKITVTVVTSKGKTETYSVELKANIGESSYTTKASSSSSGNNSEANGGTFDFPFGE